MAAAVVELNALADAVGARAQDQHLHAQNPHIGVSFGFQPTSGRC